MMIQLLAAGLISLTCIAVGNLVIRPFRFETSPGIKLAMGFGFGLAVLAYMVLGIGLLGILNRMTLTLIAGLFMAVFAVTRREVFMQVSGTFKSCRFTPSKTDYAVFLCVLAALFSSFLGTLAPETANDSLCYHVHLPKLFLQAGKVAPIPYEVNSYFPFFMEMLFTFGLGIHSVQLAQLFHWQAGILGMLTVIAFSRVFLSARSSVFAGFLFVTVPGIINQLSTTYIDAALAAYTALAVFCFLIFWKENSKSWLLASACFLGICMGIKYMALVSVLAVVILFAVQTISRKTFKSSVSLLLMCAAAVILLCGYWYARSWIETGNPVYPYFYSVFKAGDPTIHYDDIGVAKSIWQFLILPWTITVRPDFFEGYGVQLGPAFLMLVPFALLKFRSEFYVRVLAGYFLIYLLAWFLLGQSLRFLFPVLPVLAFLAGSALDWLGASKRGEVVMKTVLTLIFALHAVLGVYHYRKVFKAALGLETQAAYLSRVERSFEPAEFVNANLPADAKILAADESHLFYFNRPIIREVTYARVTEYDKKVRSLSEALRLLRSDGFTHILRAEWSRESAGVSVGTGRIPSLLKTQEDDLALYLKPLYTKRFTDTEGIHFDYILYEIL